MNLNGAAVLITGGRRVGRELALMLAGRGSRVAMTYKTSRQVIEETVGQIEKAGGQGLAIEADLGIASQAKSAVDRTAEAFGRLDVVVNMASVYQRTPFRTLQPSDFDAMIAANLAAPYHVAVFAGQRMLDQSRNEAGLKGKIINVGDWAVERPYRDFLPYLTAKGGLSTMTLALARELAPDITVNAILPAMIEPPPDLTPSEFEAVIADTPLRRHGSPGDLNRFVLYLLEGTDFATGGLYRLDGGRFLGPITSSE